VAGKEICGENTGFLTLRRCDKEATAKCAICGKPVCQEHGPKGASGSIACITCIRDKKDQLPPKPQGQDQYRNGYPYYYDYYGPYYTSYYYDDYHPYSVHDRFDEKDYSVFNAEAPEQGFEGS
jgi:hypothetical protein